MKMYLDSERTSLGDGSGTAGVLVHHVRERVVEGYREFLDVVANADGNDKGEEGEEVGGLMGVVRLGEMLSEVIDEVDAGGEYLLTSPQ